MAKMMMRSDGKPPLARSPIMLRPRRAHQNTANILQTPPGSLTKTQLPNRCWDVQESELRPEYRTISCELRALAKMVNQELGNGDVGNVGLVDTFSSKCSPVFERGRFYEEYSARRNERLKRKKGMTGEEKKAGYDLGVRVESAKRRDSKKLVSSRKAAVVLSTPMTVRREISSRYSLRSSVSKESRKLPLAVAVNSERCVGVGARRVRKT